MKANLNKVDSQHSYPPGEECRTKQEKKVYSSEQNNGLLPNMVIRQCSFKRPLAECGIPENIKLFHRVNVCPEGW